MSSNFCCSSKFVLLNFCCKALVCLAEFVVVARLSYEISLLQRRVCLNEFRCCGKFVLLNFFVATRDFVSRNFVVVTSLSCQIILLQCASLSRRIFLESLPC